MVGFLPVRHAQFAPGIRCGTVVAWMAGTGPAMTVRVAAGVTILAPAV
jgi:hypothetical protein